jgi:hypothetical protein
MPGRAPSLQLADGASAKLNDASKRSQTSDTVERSKAAPGLIAEQGEGSPLCWASTRNLGVLNSLLPPYARFFPKADALLGKFSSHFSQLTVSDLVCPECRMLPICREGGCGHFLTNAPRLSAFTTSPWKRCPGQGDMSLFAPQTHFILAFCLPSPKMLVMLHGSMPSGFQRFGEKRRVVGIEAFAPGDGG